MMAPEQCDEFNRLEAEIDAVLLGKNRTPPRAIIESIWWVIVGAGVGVGLGGWGLPIGGLIMAVIAVVRYKWIQASWLHERVKSLVDQQNRILEESEY